jgi:Spy/CpxP family protein refolding chaperone
VIPHSHPDAFKENIVLLKKLLCVAAAAAVLPVWAQPAPGPLPAGGCPDHGVEAMARHLDLSKPQLKALRDIEDKYRSRLRDVDDRLADNRKALADLKAGDPKLRELADAGGKAMADMIVLRTQMKDEMDKVLTDAQREKMRNHADGAMAGPFPHGH